MLFNSIQSAQNGDQNEMLYLISRFQSVICKYGRKLAYEDANDDLLVDFIDFVTKFDFKKLNNLTDGAISTTSSEAYIVFTYTVYRDS